MEARELSRGGKCLALSGLSALPGAIRLEPQRRSASFQQAELQCLRVACRFGHRRCEATAPAGGGGAAERQGATAVARVDRVLQLVDPSAQRQLLLQ